MIMESRDFIPGLPSDVALQCLLRVCHKSHPQMQRVCKEWESLIKSSEFYVARRRAGTTRPAICVVQALPRAESAGLKQGIVPRYGLSVYDLQSRAWERIPAIPDFPESLPLFCQCVAVDGKLFVIGGWNPSTYEAMRTVFWFDFSRNAWRRGADMLTSRSFFACGAFDGSVYVAGGHDDSKNALRSAERYLVAEDRWESLAEMSEGRDECRGIVMGGGEFVVVSGYGTDSQGEFMKSAEALDARTGTWRRMEGFWASAACPNALAASPSGEVHSFEGGGEVLRLNPLEDWSWKRAGQAPNGGRVVAACSSDSVDFGGCMIVLVQQADGFCRGFVYRPEEKCKWEMLACGGEEFCGIAQSACFVQI